MVKLQDLTNRTLIVIEEPGASSTGGPPSFPTGALFNQPYLTMLFNEGIAVFMSEAEYSPGVLDKLVTLPATTVLDFVLPADCSAVERVEYQLGVPPGTNPTIVPCLSFPDFDVFTGGLYTTTGTPQVHREIFAGTIRFWPQPTAANVTEGDTINLYYNSTGTILVNLTDPFSFPLQYQEAPILYAASRCLPRKRQLAQAAMYEQRFKDLALKAKKAKWDQNQDMELTIGDAEEPGDQSLYRF